jgi:MYXO-CTERM domain-containing protein
MDEQQTAAKALNETRQSTMSNEWQVAFASLPVLALLLAWRHRRRHLR